MIVVFDIGNVLLRWDRRYLFRKVFDDEERMERFLSTALAMDFVSRTDVGRGLRRGGRRYGPRASLSSRRKPRMFHERWIETLGEPIEENVALLRRLRASGKPVYALSNFAEETFAPCRAEARFPERIRRSRHLWPCRLRQAGPGHLRNLVQARRTTTERTLVHRRLAPPTCAPPRRSACRRSTIAPASTWRANSWRAARCPEGFRPSHYHEYRAGFSRNLIGSCAPLASAFTPASVAAVAT